MGAAAEEAGRVFPDTRERILDAAERIFMACGYDGTSMRMITAEAKVNLAAVNYHFGSKEGLMCAVFRRRLDGLNSERLAVLDALEAQAGGGRLNHLRYSKPFLARYCALAVMSHGVG